MRKTEPWHFERTIRGRRYVGTAWLEDRGMARAIAALFTLRNWNEDPRPHLPVRKIPASAGRNVKHTIFMPDVFDSTAHGMSDAEMRMYMRLDKEIADYLRPKISPEVD